MQAVAIGKQSVGAEAPPTKDLLQKISHKDLKQKTCSIKPLPASVQRTEAGSATRPAALMHPVRLIEPGPKPRRTTSSAGSSRPTEGRVAMSRRRVAARDAACSPGFRCR